MALLDWFKNLFGGGAQEETQVETPAPDMATSAEETAPTQEEAPAETPMEETESVESVVEESSAEEERQSKSFN